jgi:transposase-like protein
MAPRRDGYPDRRPTVPALASVDDEGKGLDLLVQRRRDARAAAKLMRKLLRKQGFAPKTLSPTSSVLRSGQFS